MQICKLDPMNKLTLEQTELYKKIDDILWNEWDPIAINDSSKDARDEYYSYLPHIFSLKLNDPDKLKIATYLYNVETIRMGLEGNKKHCDEIAEKIIAIK